MNNYPENAYPLCVLIHFGELTLKCGNRSWFEEKLTSCVRSKLQGLDICRFGKEQGRIIIEFAEPYTVKTLQDRLSKVFGVAVYAPAIKARVGLADIEQAVICGLKGRQSKSFAVRARRVEKNLPYSSQEVNEKIGSVVGKLTGWQVNLDDPGLTIWIDIMKDASYIYMNRFKGAGGLPAGTAGRVGVLISGGIDSPVAAWRMMKRGCEPVFIHFHSAPFTDRESIEKVEEIVERLAGWQTGTVRLGLVPLGDIQKKIVTQAHEKYRVILYRRFMVRIAEAIAKGANCEALVTGEALGQVASQTLSNMATIDSVATLPILRPLVGMDKQEIVDMAREIGTYDLSIEPHQDCCQFLEPRHPVTNTTREELFNVEAGLNIDELVKEGLTGVEWKVIKAVEQ